MRVGFYTPLFPGPLTAARSHFHASRADSNGSGAYFPMTNCCPASLNFGELRLLNAVTVPKLMSVLDFKIPRGIPIVRESLSSHLKSPPANLSSFLAPTAPFAGRPWPTLRSRSISSHLSVHTLSPASLPVLSLTLRKHTLYLESPQQRLFNYILVSCVFKPS